MVPSPLSSLNQVLTNCVIKSRGILSAEVSARDGGRYVRNEGRPPPRYVRNGRRLKEKSLFDEKK